MNQRGYIHIVLPVTIFLISAVLVGVSVFYKANKDTSRTATPTVSQQTNTPVITNTLTNSSTNTNVSDANTTDTVDTTDSTNSTTDTIDPTAGWETYENDYYNLSFALPKTWSSLVNETKNIQPDQPFPTFSFTAEAPDGGSLVLLLNHPGFGGDGHESWAVKKVDNKLSIIEKRINQGTTDSPLPDKYKIFVQEDSLSLFIFFESHLSEQTEDFDDFVELVLDTFQFTE